MNRNFRTRLAHAVTLPAGLLSVIASSAASAAPAGTTTPGESFVGEMLAIVIPLVLIIVGLLFLLRLVRRRYGLTGGDAPLSVQQILPLGPRERLVVVKSRAGRVFAVGVGAHTVTYVTDLDADDLPSAPPAASVPAANSSANIGAHR